MFTKRFVFLRKALKLILSVAVASSVIGLAAGPAAEADELPTMPAPAFSQVEPMDNSFCADLLNFDADATYTFTQLQGLPARGYIWRYNGREIACAEVADAGETASFDVIVSKAGFLDNHATLTGTSLFMPETEVTFSNYVQTMDGFTVDVNPKTIAEEVRSLSTSSGQASFASPTHIAVTGLPYGQSANLVVTVTRPNYYTVMNGFTGTALSSAQEAARIAAEEEAARVAAEAERVAAEARSAAAHASASAQALADQERARAAVEQATKDYLKAQQEIKDQQVALEKKKAADKLAADTAAVDKLASLPTSGTASTIARFTSDQFALIPEALLQALPTKTIARLTVTQAAGITVVQLRALTVAQLKALSPAAIGAIDPDVFGTLSVAKLRVLSKAQVKQVWFGQIAQLDAAQRKAIKR